MPFRMPTNGISFGPATDLVRRISLQRHISAVGSFFQSQLSGRGEQVSRWVTTCDLGQVRSDSHCQGSELGKTPEMSSRN